MRSHHVTDRVFSDASAAERLRAEVLHTKPIDFQTGSICPADEIVLALWAYMVTGSHAG
jgi:hypothetical protein